MSSAKTGSGKTKSAGSRSYYSDEYTDYSDSFVSEDDDLPPLKKAGKTILAKKTASVAASNKKSTAGTVRGRNTKNATRNASKATTTPRVDYVAKRMLSARRLKINELRNENENLAQQVNDLKHENKYLKRTQHRQEKALERFEDQDSELPRLIEQHSEEVRSLKEQIRKYKDKLNRSDRRKREIEDELAKTTKDLKKLNVIASDKKLAEREELSKKLSKTEINLEEKEHKCQELSRHVENLQKNHRRELATEVSKHRDLQRENAELKQELERALGQVKEKEKELDIKNIYSNRVLKPPHKLPTSTHSSPTPSPPSKPTKKQKKNSPDISPREKAKLMEEKRREDERRKREEKLRREERDRKTIEPPSMDWDNFSLSQDKGQERREQEERERREREEHERRDRLEQERRDRESRLRREEEERKRREWEEEEISLKNERNRMKREAEERQRREEEERERQERDRQEREDRERRDREEREERERREREERDGRERREREDRERRAREEADRLANDTKSQEERRKKDLLLQRMKQIDDTKSKGDPIDISPITKKPVKETSDFSPSADRKQYTFPKPVQNLHNGLPSHDDDIDKKNKKRNFIFDDDDLEGGYNPSFTQTTKNQSPKGRRIQRGNRSNLMESLFGDEGPKPKSSFGEDDIFSSATKAKPVSDRKSLPWGNDSKTNNNNDSLGSPLFGESTNTNNKLLPRRQRQDVSAFHAKPTVNAVDDFDDDIEEVVL